MGKKGKVEFEISGWKSQVVGTGKRREEKGVKKVKEEKLE